jgi:ATP-dependent Lhr-like helicase
MTSLAQQLLTRHGVVTRETVTHEGIAGGFSTVYQILKAMEDAGRARRGYFVAGLGGAQFAMPAALDLLRSMRDVPDEPRTVVLAATDPANPYGSILKWPDTSGPPALDDGGPAALVEGGRGPTRSVGSIVVLVDGAAAAYLKKGERELLLFAPDDEPRRATVIRQVARMLLRLAAAREEGRRGMLIVEVNSVPATAHPAAQIFIDEGFLPTAMGLQARVPAGTKTT